MVHRHVYYFDIGRIILGDNHKWSFNLDGLDKDLDSLFD